MQRRIAKQAATVQAQKKAMQTLANLQKKVENTLTSRKEVLAARRAALEAKQLVGYQGGEKIGKHKVLSGNVDVQLGEDLSENMREVKVSSFFVRRYRTSVADIGRSPKETSSEIASELCRAGRCWNRVSDNCTYSLYERRNGSVKG